MSVKQKTAQPFGGIFKMEPKADIADATDLDSSLDSVHMQLLEKALLKTTIKCVSSLKPTLLKQHFQPVYKYDPKVLLQLHEGVVTELNAKIQEEVAVMFEEESISDFMVKLDQLRRQSDGSAAGTTAWRPSGCPETDVRAHLWSVRRQHLKQLNKVLDQLQSQNSLLHQSLKKYREKLRLSQAAIAEHCHAWNQVSCLKQEDHQELEAFVNCFGQNNIV